MARISELSRWHSSNTKVRGSFAEDLLKDDSFTDSFEEFKSILEEIGKKVPNASKGKKAHGVKKEVVPINDGEENDLHILPVETPIKDKTPAEKVSVKVNEQNKDQISKLAPSKKEPLKAKEENSDKPEKEAKVKDTEKEEDKDVSSNEKPSSDKDEDVTQVAETKDSTVTTEVDLQRNAAISASEIKILAGEKSDKTPEETSLFEDSSEVLSKENLDSNEEKSDVSLLAEQAAPEGEEVVQQLLEPTTVEPPVVASPSSEASENLSEPSLLSSEADLSEVIPVPHVAQTPNNDGVLEYSPQEPMAKETFELIEQALRAIFEEKSKIIDSSKTPNVVAPGFVTQELFNSNNNNTAVLKALFAGASDHSIGNPVAALSAMGSLEGVRSEVSSTQISGVSEASRPGSRGAENSQAKAPRSLSRAFESRTLEKVENALKEIVKSRDGKTISFRLDPPSLGTVKIDVSYRDGSLHAKIQPEASQVGNFLREKAYELVGVLRKLGLNVEKITVSILNFEMTSDYEAPGFGAGSNANEGKSSGEKGQRLRDEITAENFGDAAQESGEAAKEQQPLDHWVA